MNNKDIINYMNSFPHNNNDEDLKSLWDKLPMNEEPDCSDMEECQRFREKLAAFEQGQQLSSNKSSDHVKHFKWNPFIINSVAAVFLLTIGALFFQSATIKSNTEELNQIKEMLAESLLNESEATSRINGILMTSNFDSTPSLSLQQELLNILNHDGDLNVRLAALQVLTKKQTSYELRQRLISSITKQQSPLVTLTLTKRILEDATNSEYLKITDALDNSCLQKERITKIKRSIQNHI